MTRARIMPAPMRHDPFAGPDLPLDGMLMFCCRTMVPPHSGVGSPAKVSRNATRTKAEEPASLDERLSGDQARKRPRPKYPRRNRTTSTTMMIQTRLGITTPFLRTTRRLASRNPACVSPDRRVMTVRHQAP